MKSPQRPEEETCEGRERDADTNAVLGSEGWIVVRLWEHESAVDAADQVESVVRTQLARPSE